MQESKEQKGLYLTLGQAGSTWPGHDGPRRPSRFRRKPRTCPFPPSFAQKASVFPRRLRPSTRLRSFFSWIYLFVYIQHKRVSCWTVLLVVPFVTMQMQCRPCRPTSINMAMARQKKQSGKKTRLRWPAVMAPPRAGGDIEATTTTTSVYYLSYGLTPSAASGRGRSRTPGAGRSAPRAAAGPPASSRPRAAPLSSCRWQKKAPWPPPTRSSRQRRRPR